MSIDTRRHFLKKSTLLAGSTFGFPAIVSGQNLNSKIQVACIGVGGKGDSDTKNAAKCGGHIAALCDIDRNTVDRMAKTFPKASKHSDFREMLSSIGDKIDAVTVSTPDHLHGVASIMAMQMGKHIYCQKPLTQTVWESRFMRNLAREKKLATQMGNQGSAANGLRRSVEIIQSGVIGNPKELHVWTNRPVWPQGLERPAGSDPIPEGLNWDCFIGPAQMRPYKKDLYHTFKWRGWSDFGTGALGDMACHTIDGAVWGLRLTEADTFQVEAESGGPKNGGHALDAVVRWDFPARGDMPAMSLWWYQGNAKPKNPKGLGKLNYSTLYHGEKGFMTSSSHCGGGDLLPKSFAKSVKQAEKTIARVPSHSGDWIRAMKDKSAPAPSCNFDYSGRLTEIVLAGIVALEVGEKLTFDMKTSKFTNNDNANAFLWRKPRKGWEFGYPA